MKTTFILVCLESLALGYRNRFSGLCKDHILDLGIVLDDCLYSFVGALYSWQRAASALVMVRRA